MLSIRSVYVTVGLALLAGPASATTLTITSPASAAAMVASLVGANPGIHVVAGSETYGVTNAGVFTAGVAAASGLFTGDGNVLPSGFASGGVILTSGLASSAAGPNDTTTVINTNNNFLGDERLTTIARSTLPSVPNLPTQDASMLTFSFTSDFNTVSFQYVFGSEEYANFGGSQYNDVFGFLLNGQNIALIPGTSTGISIASIHDTSSVYFSTVGSGAGISYDGLVGVRTPIFAVGSVTPGAVNTIALGVADGGFAFNGVTPDRALDSAVMLAAGSLRSFTTQGPTTPVPEPGTLALLGAGLLFGGRYFKRRAV